MQNSKKCNKCEEILNSDYFYKDIRRNDGYRTICKYCEGSIKVKPTHIICETCLLTKEYNMFSLRNKNCKECVSDERRKKKRINSKERYDNSKYKIINNSISYKTCIKCDILKEIEQFPIRLECKDGHRNHCIDCYKIIKSDNKKTYNNRNRKTINAKDIIYRKIELCQILSIGLK